MKKIYIVFLCCMLLIPAVHSTVAITSNHTSTSESQKLTSEEKSEVKVFFTIHKFDGNTKQIVRRLPAEKIETLQKTGTSQNVLRQIAPKEIKDFLESDFQENYNHFSKMNLRDLNGRYPLISMLSKILGISQDVSLRKLAENSDQNSDVFFNALCGVNAYGAGRIFPPIIPVTPFLYTWGSQIVRTKGLLGEWEETPGRALFIPFIGVSIYIPIQQWFYAKGVSGLTIAF